MFYIKLKFQTPNMYFYDRANEICTSLIWRVVIFTLNYKHTDFPPVRLVNLFD